MFAGGCAITHALLTQKNSLFGVKYKKIIANDINSVPKLFVNAVIGKYRNEKRWISREMFFKELKKEKPDPYIKWTWSFSNSGKDYLFSKELEPIKKAFHYVVMFDDWKYFDKLYNYKPLKKILTKYRIDDQKIFLDLYKNNFRKGLGRKEHLRVIKFIQKNWNNVRYSFTELQQLQQIQQLERLERIQQLEQLEVLQKDYRDVKIEKNSVVYCDIPYRVEGAKDYLKEEFNHSAFWEWAETQKVPVYVSEYNYWGKHPEKWEIVWQKEKLSLRTINKEGKRNKRIEKVFWNKIKN